MGSPTASLAFVDSTVSNGTGYLYQISSNNGGFNVDLAVPFAYTYTATTGTLIHAVDFTELRSAVNAARAAVGLQAYSFTGTISAGVTVQRVHLMELRSNVDIVRAAVGASALSYTDSTVTANVTLIKSAHIVESRNGLK